MGDNKRKSISCKDALKTLGGLALFPVASSISSKAASNEKNFHPKTKSSSSHKPAKREVPNILFIIDDQHRSDFLGAAGADWIKTPNLDK
ncbi:MAG TPA: hypothetical protein VMU83_03240 [Hanamia sp.]|nr:hypothetical protein [Hanamia sp.]